MTARPSPLATNGCVNLPALMRRAIDQARTMTGLPWRLRMSIALRASWKAAQREAAFQHYAEPAPVQGACVMHTPSDPVRMSLSQALGLRPRRSGWRGFIRGSAIHAHGW